MSVRKAELLLAAVIIARSMSLLFVKVGLGTISPFNLIAARFCIAFVILAVIFHKRLLRCNARDIKCGAALGGAFFVTISLEVFALRVIPSTTVSFLSNCAIVLVPLIEAVFLRRMPDRKCIICAALSLMGVGCLTLKNGGAIGYGECLGMLEAVSYALAIILTGKLSREGDAYIMGIFQVGFMGVFALVASFIFETPRLPEGGTEWVIILMLAVVCSCFGFTFQPVAQRCIPEDRAAQFCALNPLTASTLGVLFLGEKPGVPGIVGAALILSGIVLQNVRIKLPKRAHN